MPKAEWNGVVLAESSTTEKVDKNPYFPKDSLNMQYFKDSPTTSMCPYKGTASYYSIEVNGETNKDAAWYYPTPKQGVANIKDHVAFWKGVKVSS